MIKFSCPKCSTRFAVDNIHAGKKAKCKCGVFIRVPSVSNKSVSNKLDVTDSISEKQNVIPKAPRTVKIPSRLKEPPAAKVTSEPKSEVKAPPKDAKKDNLDSEKSMEKTRKEFGKLGLTVIFLGLASFLFIADATDELATLTFVGIVFCLAAGAWLIAGKSIPAGVVAGVSLVVLGFIDLLLALNTGSFAYIAPLIDFAFAIRVFIGCANYANVLNEAEPDELEGC